MSGALASGEPARQEGLRPVHYISPRLPHVVTRADLALLVAPTYAEVVGVEPDEAHDRVARALEAPDILADLLRSISTALEPLARGGADVDTLVDKLSKGVEKRRGRVKGLPASPALVALMVRLNLALGLAPESMRATLESDKGRQLLEQGLLALGAHLVKALVK